MYNKYDIEKEIRTKQNLKQIISTAETLFVKKFNAVEIDSLIQYIKKLDINSIYKNEKNIDSVNKFIINNYKLLLNENDNFDIQEYLKDEINESSKKISNYENFHNKESFTNLSEMKNSDIIDLTKILNRDSLLRDSNILIDSRYQNLANSDRSKISFNIISGIKNKSAGSGIISSSSNIKDIVELEIFPFSIPYITDADNYYKKITLSILELSASSIEAYEDSQFHFMFKTERNLNLLDLTPINNIFRFHKPIRKLSEFTLRFGSPLSPIQFDKDRLFTKFIDYNSNPALIEFKEDHNLLSGDIIYITDFTSNEPAKDLVIINELNSTKGHTCSRISNTTISINIDLTLVSNPDETLPILVYFGSKRILMPMRIRYMESDTT